MYAANTAVEVGATATNRSHVELAEAQDRFLFLMIIPSAVNIAMVAELIGKKADLVVHVRAQG